MSSEVVFLYDQVMEHLVRLRWFASSVEVDAPEAVDDEIDLFADLLAKRDLLVFAASLRNFGEATNSITRMKDFTVRLCEATTTGPDYHRETSTVITLYQALSRILHARYAMIVRHPIALLAWQDVIEEHQEVWSRHENLDHPLIRLVTSDGDTLVKVDGIVSMSCAYLSQMLETLGEKMIIARVDRDA